MAVAKAMTKVKDFRPMDLFKAFDVTSCRQIRDDAAMRKS
jgi:hypothetical protein